MTLAGWLRQRGDTALRRLQQGHRSAAHRLAPALPEKPPAMARAAVPAEAMPAGPYQSFPGSTGASDSWGKLAALKLPVLDGKSFLDVGCNEGFFCGFASFRGAIVSVGIDRHPGFVEAARHRFPACDFLEQDWASLPARQFDVILLASALHYADDQAALLGSLVGHLTLTGTLVLELAVADQRSEQRGTDRRSFPTWRQLGEMLDEYAWKHVGPSVRQAGDPVGREVIHIQRHRPFAYLLMAPPAHGKTMISLRLFARAGIRTVSGEALFIDIAAGRLPVSARLAELVIADFSKGRVDQTIRRAYDAGLAAELVDLWLLRSAGEDFAFDGFVPVKHHREVIALLEARHYQPIRFEWERPGDGPPAPAASEAAAVAYRRFLALAATDAAGPADEKDGTSSRSQ